LVSLAKNQKSGGFDIDKNRRGRYISFNGLKQKTNAMTRRVVPLRKQREKAAGVSLRERGAVNVPCERSG
jgi:hypothetical protein